MSRANTNPKTFFVKSAALDELTIAYKRSQKITSEEQRFAYKTLA
jgi:hypothetical protein